MAKVTVIEVIYTKRHKYQVRKISTTWSDSFSIYRVLGGTEKYMASSSSLAEAIAMAKALD